jgi:DNA-binding NarL/FixJ family response regulator
MTPDLPLRLVVVDDQTSVREGLVIMLNLLPEIDVVGSAGDGLEALAVVDETVPDAVLLDLHMPRLDGVQTTTRLTAKHPEIAVVVLTTFADDESVRAALAAGSRGILTKDADRADIADALRSALRGLLVMDSAVRRLLIAGPDRTAAPASCAALLPDGLTAREAEILGLISAGHSNAEIADRLFLSGHTVKSHINRIFAKTGSANRSSAIRYARAHGL